MLKVFFIAPLALLSGCATIMSGTDQTVTVSTTPPAATCVLDRVGSRIGAIPLTPGSVRIDKSRNDISVTCVKEGFQTAVISHSSRFNGATFGNIIVGGVIGVLVDASSGANFNYPADIRLDMAAVSPAAPTPMASQGSYITLSHASAGAPAYTEATEVVVQPVSARVRRSTR